MKKLKIKQSRRKASALDGDMRFKLNEIITCFRHFHIFAFEESVFHSTFLFRHVFALIICVILFVGEKFISSASNSVDNKNKIALAHRILSAFIFFPSFSFHISPSNIHECIIKNDTFFSFRFVDVIKCVVDFMRADVTELQCHDDFLVFIVRHAAQKRTIYAFESEAKWITARRRDQVQSDIVH